MAYTAYYGRLSLIVRSSDVNESEGNFKILLLIFIL